LIEELEEPAKHPGSSGEQSDNEPGDTEGARFDDDIIPDGVLLDDEAPVWFLPFPPAPKPVVSRTS
jgi:hypothetical protein